MLLDSSLYNTIRSCHKNVAVSKRKVSVQSNLPISISHFKRMYIMRYSYGIMDRRKILLYEPYLFLSGDDLLVFPTKDFHKWHGDIKEYIDGLYQINSNNMDKTKSINITEFNLTLGVLNNITEVLEQLFDPKKI